MIVERQLVTKIIMVVMMKRGDNTGHSYVFSRSSVNGFGEDIKEIAGRIFMMLVMMMKMRVIKEMMVMKMMMKTMTPGVLGAKVLRLIDDLAPGFNMLPPVGYHCQDDLNDNVNDNDNDNDNHDQPDPPRNYCIEFCICPQFS